jgi:hypothetical protein
MDGWMDGIEIEIEIGRLVCRIFGMRWLSSFYLRFIANTACECHPVHKDESGASFFL